MKLLITTLVLLFSIRGAEAPALKFNVDLVNISLYQRGETGEYFLGLSEATSGDLFLLSATDGPIRVDIVPDAKQLRAAALSPLGKRCLLEFLASQGKHIHWWSFVKSAAANLNPEELMVLPDSIWAQLSLNEIAKILGRIPNDDFVKAIIRKLEQEGRPVHEITARAHIAGLASCLYPDREGVRIAYTSWLFTITLDGKRSEFIAPTALTVRRQLFKEGEIVSQGQLLFVFSERKHKWRY